MTAGRYAAVALVALLLSGLVGAVSPRADAAPLGKFGSMLSFALSGFNPLAVTSDGPSTFTLTGHVTNTGQDAVTDLAYRFQRGDVLTDNQEIRATAADPGQPIAVVNDTFVDLPGTLRPGEGMDFAVSVPITGEPEDSLAVTEPGIFPVMVNVNATVQEPSGPTRARVGELHVLLSVQSVPRTTPPESPSSDVPTHEPAAINLMIPLVDRPHLAVGGVFADDDLRREIEPGGRIATLLDTVEAAGAADSDLTVVVDPMLLDELDRMGGGYRVLASPGKAQPALTPESVASTDPPPGTVAGTGSAIARVVLDRIRAVAERYQVLVLPYGDPDVVAMVREGLTDELAITVFRGKAVASRILSQPINSALTPSNLVTTVAFPPGGVMTSEAWSALQALGYTSAVLDPAGVSQDAAAQGLASVTSESGTATMVVAGAGAAGTLIPVTNAGPPEDWPTRLNLLAALLTHQQSQRTGPPMVIAPPRDWAPDPRGVAVVSALARTLAEVHLAEGAPLVDIVTGEGKPVATQLRYSKAAAAAELPEIYLSAIHRQRMQISRLDESLSPAPGPDSPDPKEIIGPLHDALLGAWSAAWRGDDQPDRGVRATVTSTLQGLQDAVHLRASTSSYTLASSSAPLLLSVENSLPYIVDLRIRILGGARVGLSVDDPGVIRIPAGPRTAPLKLASTVSRSGTFTVYAQLDGIDGIPWGAQVPLTITSRAYGVLTLVLMLVAGGLMLVMVAFRIRQRWRTRRLKRQPALDGATEPDDPSPAASP